MKNKNFRMFINGLSLFLIVSGGLGMLYCAPHLWSARMEDIVGAGFPFVGGSILFASGLLALSITNKN
jgi:hypothetical protein